MNKIYKVIWNSARGCYVVVHEFAKCNGKKAQAVVLAGLVAASLGMAGTAHAENKWGQQRSDDGAEITNAEIQPLVDVNGSVYGGWVTNNGIVTSSSASIEGTEVTESVYGGAVDGNNSATYDPVTGKNANIANNNSVTIQEGMVGRNVYGGRVDGNGNANENNVTVKSGSEITRSVIGGFVNKKGNADKNIVTVTDSTVNHRVTGGLVGDDLWEGAGDAKGNQVTVSNSTVKYGVYGANVENDGDAGDEDHPNTVTIENSNVGRVFGGFVDSTGNASYNTVSIKGQMNGSDSTTNVKVNDIYSYDHVAGGYVDSVGNAHHNTVTIAGSMVETEIYGGNTNYSPDDKGGSYNNKVEITGGIIDNSVYGGYVRGNGSAYNNTVTIDGTEFTSLVEEVVGGSGADEGSTYENKVTIKNVETVNAEVITGGYGGKEIRANHVIIENVGTLNSEVCGGSAGWDDEAKENTVSITGDEHKKTTIKQAVYGGFASYRGSANNNEVEITNSIAESEVFGGFADYDHYDGLYAEDKSTNNNKVTISNSTLKESVYGGSLYADGTSSGNTVTIKDGSSVEKNVYGGYGGTAENNTVNLEGTLTFDKNNSVIYGGIEFDTIIYKTGNTLNLTNTKIELSNIAGFKNINFALPKGVNADDKIVTLNTTGDTDIEGSTIKVGMLGTNNLEKEDKLYLIYKKDGTLNAKDATAEVYKDLFTQTTSNYEVQTEQADKTTDKALYENDTNARHLILKKVDDNPDEEPVDPPEPEDPTEPDPTKPDPTTPTEPSDDKLSEDYKSPVETRAAEAAFLNKSADNFVMSTIPQAVRLSAAEGEFVPFATMQGGKYRENSGSHVDMVHRGVNVGVAKTLEQGNSKITFGPFFEYAWGSYDSYLNNGVHGEGDLRHTGGGLFVHSQNKAGVYVEASARAGKVKGDYETNDGLGFGYDTSSTYYGAHLALGKVHEVGNGNTLDTYARYLWTHVGSDSVATPGETYEFDSVTSNRFQLGAKYNFANGLYAGAAWQYEASGSAEALYGGKETMSPSLKGHTGIMELGWKTEGKKLDVDFGVTGYAGQERGVAMHLGAAYHF